MKILKLGRKQKGWAKKYKCTGKGNGNGGCGAELLVEEGDLFYTHNYDYGGGHDVFKTFRCPSCKVLTDVDDVPSNVKIRQKENVPSNKKIERETDK